MYIEGLLKQNGTPSPNNEVPIDQYLVLKDNNIFTGEDEIIAVYEKVIDKEKLKELLNNVWVFCYTFIYNFCLLFADWLWVLYLGKV